MPAGGIIGVLQKLPLNAVSNPVEARIGTNVIAFLNWAGPLTWASSGGTLPKPPARRGWTFPEPCRRPSRQ
ncbi:MAG TPA: hypothetical protein DHV85_07280 [Candidatus Accumulibacter sp.]|nr:hypothetical protein [Accumulibacter sp.]